MTFWHRLLLLGGGVGLLFFGCRLKQDTRNSASSPPDPIQMIRPHPNVSSVEFRDQEGRSVRLSDLRGKPVLMSFIYTRCPMPTMCPLTTKQFVAVQKALRPEERSRVTLVLISFDPDYDTPSVLKRYGDAYGVDWANLQMWTGSKQNIFDLTDSFGMWYKKEEGDYAHRTFSVVLDAEGKYVADLRGADWDVPGAVELLRSLMKEP